MENLDEIEKLVKGLSDRELLELLRTVNKKNNKQNPNANTKRGSWMDKNLVALNQEGLTILKELEEQNNDLVNEHYVNKKRLRYLRTLKSMKLKVPAFFRDSLDAKQMYKDLRTYCLANDIPEEIVRSIVPSLLKYIKTGRMSPVIFVGKPGCGKTTAMRILLKEALQIPVEVVKIPQLDGSHGMTGDNPIYCSSDVGCIAKARLRKNSFLVAYIFDEIDKTTHDRGRANVDDELLSMTDESNFDIIDNYLGTTIVGLEYCPMFFTANDIQKVNPILADRCTIIHFPDANAARIKSISKKFVEKKLTEGIYSMIRFDYELMNKSIDRLVNREVTSLRKHQQLIEAVLENALDIAFTQEGDAPVRVTESMFVEAEKRILDGMQRKLGFAS